MENWLPWKNSDKQNILSEEGAPSNHALSLVSRLANQISEPKEATRAFSSLKIFENSSEEQQLKQLPALFLLLAQYLIEIEKKRPMTRESVINLVKNEYSELLEIQEFSLIFSDTKEQEVLLCRKFVNLCIDGAYPLLGEALKPILEQAHSEELNNHRHYESLNPGDHIAMDSDALRWLRHIAIELFNRLEQSAGIELAERIFEKSYQKMTDVYASLDTFPVIVNMLPEKILDEKKLSMLSQRQTQRVLLNNIRKLEEVNKNLESKNTELEQLNSEITKAKEDLDEANRAKSMFLASMSHELRTPLTAVIGFSQILENDANLSSTQRYYISIMHQSGSHLLSMINDVLDLSKIEAGQLEISEKLFNLHILLTELQTMFSVLTNERDIDFKMEIHPELPLGIQSDDNKIKQILINLLSNAVKYTNKGFVKLTAAPGSDPNLIVFRVQDSGIGIPEDKLHEIFDPFKQVQNSESKGTGLGLSISQKLATLLAGSIQVESTLNEGSTFSFELPYTHVDEELVPHKESKFNRNITGIRGDKTWHILVVDNDENNRILLESMLGNVGFKMTEATNGMECLEVLHTTPVDLVLLDLAMPVMDGHQTFQKIRQEDELKQIPVIAITAAVLKNQDKELLNEGFDDCITKPFNYSDFFQKLSEALDLEYTYQEKVQSQE